jgi:hypothetical protein
MPSGFWPAITRRAAASSVAPVAVATSAPCVLASLGASDPEPRKHYREGALESLHRADRAALGERIACSDEGFAEPLALTEAWREDLVELEKR